MERNRGISQGTTAQSNVLDTTLGSTKSFQNNAEIKKQEITMTSHQRIRIRKYKNDMQAYCQMLTPMQKHIFYIDRLNRQTPDPKSRKIKTPFNHPIMMHVNDVCEQSILTDQNVNLLKIIDRFMHGKSEKMQQTLEKIKQMQFNNKGKQAMLLKISDENKFHKTFQLPTVRKESLIQIRDNFDHQQKVKKKQKKQLNKTYCLDYKSETISWKNKSKAKLPFM